MAIRWWWFHHWSCMKSQLLLDSYHSTVAGNQCFDVVDLVWLKWAENLRVVCLDVGYDFYKAPSHWSNAVGEKQNGLSCIFCLKWYFLKFFCHCVFLTFAGPNSWRWIIHFATSIVTGGVYVCVCVSVCDLQQLKHVETGGYATRAPRIWKGNGIMIPLQKMELVEPKIPSSYIQLIAT